VLQKGLMHATFIQKVLICAIAALFAAALVQWGKVFIEGANDALNKGYEHPTIMGGP
jgi:nucleoside recognition membrane protein YjiH